MTVIFINNRKRSHVFLRKLNPVKAILWDDINAELVGNDAVMYQSPADAQCHVTNTLLESLTPCKYFIFCPTEYCAAFAQPDVGESSYLETIGRKLDEKVEIMWTGPRYVFETYGL